MKPREFLVEYEGMGDDAAAMSEENELQKTRTNCYNAAKYAIQIHKLLQNTDKYQDLDSFIKDKIEQSAEYLKTIIDHLESNDSSDDFDELEDNDLDLNVPDFASDFEEHLPSVEVETDFDIIPNTVDDMVMDEGGNDSFNDSDYALHDHETDTHEIGKEMMYLNRLYTEALRNNDLPEMHRIKRELALLAARKERAERMPKLYENQRDRKLQRAFQQHLKATSVQKTIGEGGSDDSPPFAGAQKKKKIHKDEYGNVIKPENMARHLARKGRAEQEKAASKTKRNTKTKTNTEKKTEPKEKSSDGSKNSIFGKGVYEARKNWKDERLKGCKCPTEGRKNPNCPIHGYKKTESYERQFQRAMREDASSTCSSSIATSIASPKAGGMVRRPTVKKPTTIPKKGPYKNSIKSAKVTAGKGVY